MKESKEHALQIGKHKPKYPIVQGGMGVMVSGPKLAGAVASAGGVGTIASVGLAVASPNFNGRNVASENVVMIKKSIEEARKLAKGGVLAMNCMCALSDYDEMVQTSCESGIDIIVSGAGLPLKLPELTKDYPDVALVPIVSSVKAANIILRKWEKSYNRIPDAFVVETPNTAGGHLGARDEEQAMDCSLSLKTVIPSLVSFLKDLGLNIPIISAGGIWDSQDIKDSMDLGASGVQMGTRFAGTEESDVSYRFKQAYLDAEEKDVVLIKSPAGLPGRAILSPLIKRYFADVLEKATCKTGCLTHCICRMKKETFCIADALMSAYKGDWENGLFFCGSNVAKLKEIGRVREIMEELVTGLGYAYSPL
ncbi:MAG: nitronate monooxygenase [Synergistaceae bacterium]|jgi:nitronate monooxygenase|nr:nitronate monooxygenase [Synergistaceae bacterium]